MPGLQEALELVCFAPALFLSNRNLPIGRRRLRFDKYAEIPVLNTLAVKLRNNSLTRTSSTWQVMGPHHLAGQENS
jgi:hypothetical protein